ncbi:SMI1/KNR4 family protein [Streptomyces sp. JB150]|uniref:SMI1/KNR4 family protein n=1 Tax=Streptomyces sp. JB150 TaxID=2714844 RepID=UPI001407EEBC|nr:SMI1/KNR4 family protein [Streptomyces sp. JB150]QIJ61761.1 SMI1/KNR4 family protein [Streptomyces sp. JB150]
MNTEHADPGELAALRAAFGVEGGGASALGWEKLRAFEAEHGIVLPEPYRTFVAEITDGSRQGPPAYGLLALGEVPRGSWSDPAARDLGKPFPLTEAWLWEEDEDEPDLDAVLRHGSVVLGTDGCAMDWHLIVTGPHRGHLWQITDVGALPFGAGFGHTTAAPGFAGWVAHWAAGKEWFDAPAP